MPRATVVTYFDYKSPYAYVAKSATYALEQAYDIALEWRPFTLAISKYLGSVDDRTPEQWRRVRYSYMDARRIANRQGLTVLGPQKIFDSRPAHIAFLYAQRAGAMRPFHDMTFELFWKRQLELGSIEDMAAMLAKAGIDAAGFPAWAAGEGSALHDRMKDEAEAAGVFGVPSYVVEAELYWGGDRLPMVHEHLDKLGLRR
jgi:2-hydroxychromene-2-carboxylate isomerase